jgi:hypothetical protein
MNNIRNELNMAESQLSVFNTKHTKSSATRARSHLMLVRKECDRLRKEILDQAKEYKAAKAVPLPDEPMSEPSSEPEPISEPEPETAEPVENVKKTRKPRQAKKQPKA